VPTEAELREVFKKPAVREVACEVRFVPRLRVIPEVWRIQDTLAEQYPHVDEEQVPVAANRLVQTYVFANAAQQRLIKVSQENFVAIYNKYTTFEDFKAEALMRISDFSRQFDVGTYQRVGLRYVNHIQLPTEEPARALHRYVNVPVDFSKLDIDAIEQFMTEFRVKAGPHKLTIRGALIPVPTVAQNMLYILDLDCYSVGPKSAESLSGMLDEFHREIQVRFLSHITEEYKVIMRG
jgi:uncharacterized protein (TIGR04255 family)